MSKIYTFIFFENCSSTRYKLSQFYNRKVIIIVETERLHLLPCVSFVAVILRIKYIFGV